MITHHAPKLKLLYMSADLCFEYFKYINYAVIRTANNAHCCGHHCQTDFVFPVPIVIIKTLDCQTGVTTDRPTRQIVLL